MLYLIGLAVSCSCCIFCNNCLGEQFALVEYILDKPRDYRFVSPEQIGNLCEVKPNRLSVHAHFEARLAILGLV